MNELEIYRTAKLLLDAHGPLTAWQRAAARAIELANDQAGQAVWVRVIDAIDVLTRVKRRDDESCH